MKKTRDYPGVSDVAQRLGASPYTGRNRESLCKIGPRRARKAEHRRVESIDLAPVRREAGVGALKRSRESSTQPHQRATSRAASRANKLLGVRHTTHCMRNHERLSVACALESLRRAAIGAVRFGDPIYRLTPVRYSQLR